MDDFSGVTLIAVDGRKQLLSPSHLVSLPFPSVPPLGSNPATFRNRKVDSLPAQVLRHGLACEGLNISVSGCKYMYIYLHAHVYAYILVCTHACVCVYVCLKHTARGPAVVLPHCSGGCTHCSSDWDHSQVTGRPLKDLLSDAKGGRGLLICLP